MQSENNRTNLLKTSLFNYFKSIERLARFRAVVDKQTEYSLRILEWFVSNYSKKYNVVYINRKKDFNVFLDYKSQLKSFSKKQFDPFRRHEKFDIDYTFKGESVFFETTVGQMNFFKWAIENKILDYVSSHIDEIKNDMNNSVSYKDKDKNSRTILGKKDVNGSTSVICDNRKKRQPLSLSATRSIVKRFTKVTISFE